MICISCYMIPDNDLQVNCFTNENLAKKWLVKILNEKGYLKEWFNGYENITGVSNIYLQINKLSFEKIIEGMEIPGDIKINVRYKNENELDI